MSKSLFAELPGGTRGVHVFALADRVVIQAFTLGDDPTLGMITVSFEAAEKIHDFLGEILPPAKSAEPHICFLCGNKLDPRQWCAGCNDWSHPKTSTGEEK